MGCWELYLHLQISLQQGDRSLPLSVPEHAQHPFPVRAHAWLAFKAEALAGQKPLSSSLRKELMLEEVVIGIKVLGAMWHGGLYLTLEASPEMTLEK